MPTTIDQYTCLRTLGKGG
jgi:serine/threonine protein kinase